MTLPSQKIRELINLKFIYSKTEILESQIQPASLDLTLSSKAYRTSTSFLPRTNEKIEDIIQKMTLYEFDISDGAVLEVNSSYIIPLNESLNLPSNIYGIANPKSSIGRIDVFVRVLTDYNSQFDYIPKGYKGNLYLEIIPLSFVIKIKKGVSLNQIRFKKAESQLLKEELIKLHQEKGLVLDPETNQKLEKISTENSNLVLTVDIKTREIIGWKAKLSNDIIDITKKGELNPYSFFEPIKRSKTEDLILLPGYLYLLATYERIRVPINFCAEVIPYDPPSGEFRTHYAGFFDPGFGYGEKGEILGTHAVLEARAHNIPFRITHRQIICKMKYERLLEKPDRIYSKKIGSHYIDPNPKLAKFFVNKW